ncbi:hypothetical protein N9D95_03215 [Flavobacteriales bacterium]|nr:hypothetical protein [Flavobacteriales bacterium]
MDKKSVIIGALGSALLFISLGAASPVSVQTTVPVEHEWELMVSPQIHNQGAQAYAINKRTGEVRKYSPWAAPLKDVGVAGYFDCVKLN